MRRHPAPLPSLHLLGAIRPALVASLAMVGAAGPGLAGCATVRPEDMSAAAHRREAARESRSAADYARAYESDATRRPIAPPASEGVDPPLYNPTEWNLTRAAEARDLARLHLAAAERLERAVDQACEGVPVAERPACPESERATSSEPIARGARLHLDRGADAARVIGRMQCHLAVARARGFPSALTCGYYRKGASLVVVDDGRAVEVVSDDPATARELRRVASTQVARR